MICTSFRTFLLPSRAVTVRSRSRETSVTATEFSRIRLLAAFLLLAVAAVPDCARAADFLKVDSVEAQPLKAATERLVEALEYVGSPLSAQERDALNAAFAETNAA